MLFHTRLFEPNRVCGQNVRGAIYFVKLDEAFPAQSFLLLFVIRIFNLCGALVSRMR